MAEAVRVAPEPQDVRAPRKLDSLTGLRFFAALLVFLFHTAVVVNPVDLTGPGINPFANPDIAQSYAYAFSNGGFVGVSFFFVLSGFVLSWSARPDSSARAFIRRRLVKIFPTHVVMWALVMLLFAGGVASWKTWLPNLFLVHAWFPDFSISQSINTPSWSLCSELLFYVTLPLLIRPILRMSVRQMWITAAALFAGLVAFQMIATLFLSTRSSGFTPVGDVQFWWGYLFPAGRMFEFAFGAILARIVLAGKWIRINPLLAVGFMVLGYVATYFVPAQLTFNVTTLIPIGVLLATFADADMRGAPTGLRSRLAVWLGNISFGFYMCQTVTVFYIRHVTGGGKFDTPTAVLVIIGLLALSILGGWLLHRFVEMPMMRRWSRPRTAPSPQLSGSA
ncbi:acyltransferase family protein [Micromonospora sp. NPDC049051]|uniref:acyltransferase family protein n=1 Tax=unclassified Micromonospora TaxID=2617518 RepID=UPI0037141CE0